MVHLFEKGAVHTGSKSLSPCSIQKCSVVQILLGATIGISLTLLASWFDVRSYGATLVDKGGVNQGLQLHLDGFDWGDRSFFGTTYMKRRSNYTYYLRVLDAARRYAPSAKSVIDVGAPWPYVTAFDWIPEKTMLNDRYPDNIVAPKGLKLIQGNFYDFFPETKYDLVICNQVLEHVDDPREFAKKLLSIGKVVIASVPYLWPDDVFGHKQNYIDSETLIDWFKRRDYSEFSVVKETGRVCQGACRRIFIVYEPKVDRNLLVHEPSHTGKYMGNEDDKKSL